MNWGVKYRPTSYDQIALSPSIRKIFEERVFKDSHLGDFLFYSKDPGIGKTTLAKLLGDMFNYEVIFINASKDGNMDTIRNIIDKALDYASIDKQGKLIILDEAERISQQAQESLRGILEEDRYEELNFIFTANNKNRLIKPIAESRLLPLDFTLPIVFDKDDVEFKKSVLNPIFKYLIYILNENNVKFEMKDLYTLVKNDYPNLRMIVNKMEFSIFNGVLDPNSYISSSHKVEEDILIEYIKNKDYQALTEKSHELESLSYFMNYLKKNAFILFNKEDVPKLFSLMNQYQRDSGNGIADKEINSLDFLFKLSELGIKNEQ